MTKQIIHLQGVLTDVPITKQMSELDGTVATVRTVNGDYVTILEDDGANLWHVSMFTDLSPQPLMSVPLGLNTPLAPCPICGGAAALQVTNSRHSHSNLGVEARVVCTGCKLSTPGAFIGVRMVDDRRADSLRVDAAKGHVLLEYLWRRIAGPAESADTSVNTESGGEA